ncbi:hypothetical protein F4680DRAFT_466785 [Xylaria scruposa]|nr:hypothetical protein F4680DRAFT_466785 [Xylaria scruposa]
MSQRKRKSLSQSNGYHPRKLQRLDTRERGGTEDVSNGDIETLQHLVTRLHENITPDSEQIWVSPAEAEVLTKGQRYYDLPTTKTRGPLSILAKRPRPPFVDKEDWLREIGPGLINALLKYKAVDHLESAELNAMLRIILGNHPHIKLETSLAEVFGHRLNDASNSSTSRSISHNKVKFFFFGGNRPAENANALGTWYLIVIDIRERTLYFIDPVSSGTRLSKQQRDIILHMRHLWKQYTYPIDPDNLATLEAINLPLVQSTPEINSGFACVINASLLLRPRIELFNHTRNGRKFQVSRNYNDMLMKTFEDCLQLKVHPQWRRPRSLVRLPKISFDESLVALALSVKRGNWSNLTKLVQSVFGRLLIVSDNFPIPSQITPPSVKPANTAYYKPWTPRAGVLLSDKKPPDRSDSKLWRNVIGPRIANVLICMAKRKRRLSGLEISAYLHMVLIDFFIEGYRTPKVMFENSFGDFLMRSVPQDVEWCSSAMKKKPRFLIFSRVQGMAGPHRYVIIVDTNARQAYCFDSTATLDTRAEHIEAFAFLQEVWTARMPWTPVPEQMVELPSFSQKDDLDSGFLCMYHILLRKLEHGDVVANRKDLNRIIQPAEKYIGIKFKGYTSKTTLVSRSASNSTDRNNNIPEKKPIRIKFRKPEDHSKAERHQPRKHPRKEQNAPRKPVRENRGSCFSQSRNYKPASTPTKPRSTKRNHHKAAQAQCKIKICQRGSTHKDTLELKLDRASVDAANRQDPPDRKAVRVRLQQKRGRDGDLMELDMYTMKPKLQFEGKY